jgi:hypothetical protein
LTEFESIQVAAGTKTIFRRRTAKGGLAWVIFKLQLDLEITQSSVPAPNAFGVETSGNVIGFVFIEKQRPLSRFYFGHFLA